MNAACQLCKGACCESIVVVWPAGDEGRWLGYHGKPLADGRLELETRCAMLTKCGACSVHGFRPNACADFQVGGADCRATVLRRRAANSREIIAALDANAPSIALSSQKS